jgi:hypothetical protein
MPKAIPGVERLYLKFSEPEDLALLQRLKTDAKKQRYSLQTYIMLVLLQAYPAPESGKDAAGQPGTQG